MEEGPGSIAPCGGGWHGGGGASSRQVAQPAEAVAGRASATLAGEWDSVRGPTGEGRQLGRAREQQCRF
jgi:hypothetical protein